MIRAQGDLLRRSIPPYPPFQGRLFFPDKVISMAFGSGIQQRLSFSPERTETLLFVNPIPSSIYAKMY